MDKLLKTFQADMAMIIAEMVGYLADDDTRKQTDVVVETNLRGFQVRIEDQLELLQRETLHKALHRPEGLVKELGFPKPDDYQSALYVLDACNLSGVVHSMSEVVRKIWNEASAMELGTPYVNTHPLMVLYATKVGQLTGITTQEGHRVFSEAYDMCKTRAIMSEELLGRVTWECVKSSEKGVQDVSDGA